MHSRTPWLRLCAAALLTVAAAACSGSAPQPSPNGTPAVTVDIAAHSSIFDTNTLSVPADQTFAIDLDNQDAGVPHNISIHGSGGDRTGDVVTGVAHKTYVFAALPAGMYAFRCDVHPNMTGTLTVN